MQWFRMYGEFATDSKVQSMSEKMQRRLTMLFCLQSIGDLGKLSDEEIAFTLRITEEELCETKKLFIAKNFIDEFWNIRKWDERQYISDNSNIRVQRYRERVKQNGSSLTGYLKQKDDVFKRDNFACVYCGNTENLCIDHSIPVMLGGDDHIDNLVTACKSCNSGKSGRTPEQAKLSFMEKSSAEQYKNNVSRLMSQPVTVTVTPPYTDTDSETNTEAETDTDTETKEVTPFESAFKDFKKMRNRIKKPLTDRAEKSIRKKLNEFSYSEDVQIQILEQSIVGCWADVYELKRPQQKKLSNFEICQAIARGEEI